VRHIWLGVDIFVFWFVSSKKEKYQPRKEGSKPWEYEKIFITTSKSRMIDYCKRHNANSGSEYQTDSGDGVSHDCFLLVRFVVFAILRLWVQIMFSMVRAERFVPCICLLQGNEFQKIVPTTPPTIAGRLGHREQRTPKSKQLRQASRTRVSNLFRR